MYEDFSNEIPDSDAKIYMSLDDIIKMEGIKKPGPGSVKSMASYRSTYSNRSRRSTYSNKSRRSTYSNRSRQSTYSNRSKHSTYSNRSRHSMYSNKFNHWNPVGYQNNKRLGGGRLIRRYIPYNRKESDMQVQYKVLNRPGVYVPNSQLKFYKNKVRQAIKTLSGPISKSRYRTGLQRVSFDRKLPYFKHNLQQIGINKMRRIPSEITVEVGNIPALNRRPLNNSMSLVRRQPPLTQKTLALFNKINKTKSYSHSGSIRTSHSNRSQMSNRHSVKGSLNSQKQKEIICMQLNYAKEHGSSEFHEMDFVPTPNTTGLSTTERFSTYY